MGWVDMMNLFSFSSHFLVLKRAGSSYWSEEYEKGFGDVKINCVSHLFLSLLAENVLYKTQTKKQLCVMAL